MLIRVFSPAKKTKERDPMLLRELSGGEPPYLCKLIFNDAPTGFGHRVIEGDRMVEHVFAEKAEFDRALVDLLSAGFLETERSLSRRVLVTANQFWIALLDGQTLRMHFGGIRLNWQESSGQTKNKLFRDRNRAVAAYHKAIDGKRAEGYLEKFVRNVPIPAAPKKSGKKGSR